MTDEAAETVTAEGDSGKVKAADIEVVSGNPTDAEIAALVAALSALASKAEAVDLTPRNLWAEPVDKLRYSPHSWQRVTLFERAKLARPRGSF
ncbi:MAG: acyl-CoA carboxylase epsilon subunit [Mycobacterium sp.]